LAAFQNLAVGFLRDDAVLGRGAAQDDLDPFRQEALRKGFTDEIVGPHFQAEQFIDQVKAIPDPAQKVRQLGDVRCAAGRRRDGCAVRMRSADIDFRSDAVIAPRNIRKPSVGPVQPSTL